MILRERKDKIKIRPGETKSKVLFAWTPTQLKLCEKDTDGEIIWLQRYVKTYIATQPYQYAYPEEIEWKFQKSETIGNAVLSHSQAGQDWLKEIEVYNAEN